MPHNANIIIMAKKKIQLTFIEHGVCARHYTKLFTHFISSNPHNLRGQYYHYPHFTDE